MERRYVDQLNLRFDEVAENGFTIITASELMRWWDRQRLTASIWQDMKERWEERGFTGGNDQPIGLKIAEDNHRYILAWDEDAWMVPLSEWAG